MSDVIASETANGNVRLELTIHGETIIGETIIKVLSPEEAISLACELDRLGRQCY